MTLESDIEELHSIDFKVQPQQEQTEATVQPLCIQSYKHLLLLGIWHYPRVSDEHR